MRTKSLLTTLACTAVLAGVGAGTAFAADATATPTPVPSTPTAPPRAPSIPPPPTMVTQPVPSASRSATTAPSYPPAPVPSRQIAAVPSGAPNTGVPTVASKGHTEAEAIGASLVALLGGSGTVVFRRRLKGRG